MREAGADTEEPAPTPEVEPAAQPAEGEPAEAAEAAQPAEGEPPEAAEAVEQSVVEEPLLEEAECFRLGKGMLVYCRPLN